MLLIPLKSGFIFVKLVGETARCILFRDRAKFALPQNYIYERILPYVELFGRLYEELLVFTNRW